LISPSFKLGTCCMIDSDFGYRSTTKTSFMKNKDFNKLWEIWEHNINRTEEALNILCNLESHYHFFRVSSSLFPLATLDDQEIDSFWKDKLPIIKNKISEIGSRILLRSPHFRIVTHPGQFCVPNSKNPQVVQNSIKELQYHYDFMEPFGIPFSINIHLSGKDSESPSRMINTYTNYLSDHLRKVISLENDEKSSSIKTILEVSDKVDCLVCYDIHHEAVFRTFNGEKYYFEILTEDQNNFIEKKWSDKLGLKPTMHLSNRLNRDSIKGDACAHSDFFYDSENWKVLHYLERGWDIEMEAKEKLPATQNFMESLSNMNQIYLESKNESSL